MGVCETVSVSLSSVTGLGAGSQIQVHVLYSEESHEVGRLVMGESFGTEIICLLFLL